MKKPSQILDSAKDDMSWFLSRVVGEGVYRDIPWCVRSSGLGHLCGYILLCGNSNAFPSSAELDMLGLPMHGGVTFDEVYAVDDGHVRIIGCDYGHLCDPIRYDYFDGGESEFDILCALRGEAQHTDFSDVDDVEHDMMYVIDWTYEHVPSAFGGI